MASTSTSADNFKIVTTEAYQIKVLSEILNYNIGEGNFVFDEEGVTFREADEKETVLIDITLRANDLQYDPPQEKTYVGITCQHLYKTLRRIKKKDKLSIQKDKDSNMLIFNILNTDKDRNKDAMICIKDVKKTEWTLPVYPKNPICSFPASEFQRMCKEMSGASKSITVKIQKSGVRFIGGTSQLFSVGDRYGNWVDGEPEIYCKTFDSKQISRLSKCSGLAQSNFLKLYCAGEEHPIMFVSPIGTIGTFRACLNTEN